MESTAEQYQREGVVVVRSLIDGVVLEAARSGVAQVLRDPSPLAIDVAPEGPGRFFEDFCNWSRIAEIRRVATSPAVGRVAAALMRSSTARLYHDHVLVKEADTAIRTPWHQDQPYYDVAGSQNVSFWIALDPVAIDTSLECIRDSHRGPWLMPRTFLDREARWFPEGSLAEIPEYAPDDPRIARFALAPGDAIAFNFLTVHSAPGTRTRRRILSLRYLGDDMRHEPRRWRTSPPFDDVSLAAGAELDHPQFPVVFG